MACQGRWERAPYSLDGICTGCGEFNSHDAWLERHTHWDRYHPPPPHRMPVEYLGDWAWAAQMDCAPRRRRHARRRHARRGWPYPVRVSEEMASILGSALPRKGLRVLPEADRPLAVVDWFGDHVSR